MNTEEQIKEILNDVFKFNVSAKNDIIGRGAVKKLVNLPKQQEQEILKDFSRELRNKCLHDSINESYNYPLEEVPNVVDSFIDEYLNQKQEKDK